MRHRRLAAAVALACAVASHATPAHEWFADHRYRAPDGTHCCDGRDCRPYPAEHVTVTPRGYRLHDGVEVPFRDAHMSQDRQFWRCDWGYPVKFKCLFVVVGGS